jgi:serine phosphatase RsbU (regulator of sigma subunit)
VKKPVLRAVFGLLVSLMLLGSGLACACTTEGKEIQASAAGSRVVRLSAPVTDAAGTDAPSPETETEETGTYEEKAEAVTLASRIPRGFLASLLICALCGIILMRMQAQKPLQKLTELVKQLDELDAAELTARAETIPGEAGEAAHAIAAYAAAQESRAVKERDSALSEEAYKTQVVDEICRALLPQPLKESAAGLTFALAGEIQQGKRMNCAFYDHFFLEENVLCLVVGQVPGSGIAEAMFAVVAQTAIRSRLRMGRSLIETMSDVNAQLYDLGGRNSVGALVAVLNTVSGQLNFVNAGGSMPFLMRSEGRYEWLRTPVYAALGANESVSYRSERLRLNQGDRMFFYTADLGELEDRERVKFREQELQSALNRSRSKTRSPEDLLRFMQDEAAVYCESGRDLLSAAVLALEYKKSSRDYVFTLVRGTPEYASNVTEFLRKTLEDREISPKDRAKQLLLADELFALCCRVCEAEGDVKVACAVFPEDKTIHLRMFAPMGGRDPLEAGESPAGESAASYIRNHTKRASFEAGTDRDMVEIISELP